MLQIAISTISLDHIYYEVNDELKVILSNTNSTLDVSLHDYVLFF